MATDLSTISDKLSAVNLCLRVTGEAPVDSIEVSESVDVATATATVDEISLATQSKGWHWNTEVAMTFTPDVNGNIVLPENTLWIGPAYWDSTGLKALVGERARKLYNRDDHTFTFTDPIRLDLVVFLDWDELPMPARRYIAIRAAKQFQGRDQSSQFVDKITDWEISDALMTLQEAEDRAAPENQVGGNAQVIFRLHGSARRRP